MNFFSSPNRLVPGIKSRKSGFYPFRTLEASWAWWRRVTMVNGYEQAPRPVYDVLLRLVKGKNHFILATSVDRQF